MSARRGASPSIHDYNELLVAALLARIAMVEQHVGDRYGFAVQRAHTTTAILAHRWPRGDTGVPFSRVFDYAAPKAATEQHVLNVDELSSEIVIEVLPSAHATATEHYLQAQGFTPRWRIPWLLAPLDQPLLNPPLTVREVPPHALDTFAKLLVAGYGYQGLQAAAWHDLAHYGYRAPGFTCFTAEAEQPLAAAVVYIRDRLALVDGAATLPQQRGRGAQTALLSARLAFARSQGCTHAISRTSEGSISQRNMERLGMRILAYSTAWMR